MICEMFAYVVLLDMLFIDPVFILGQQKLYR